MKKTFNINIGNSIIHIEEDAYELLTVYLNEIKQHFGRSADDFEIVTDIENRIAEMFREILQSDHKPAIDLADVEQMMKQMGSVRDFERSPEADETDASFHHTQGFSVKKLYRDADRAVIAGVCSGLAHYTDIDLRWIRLFAFLTIFVGGSGILAYIVLWVMVPKAKSRSEKMTMVGLEANLRGFASSNLDPFITESKGILMQIIRFISRSLSGFFRAVFKFAAIMIIIFASLMLIGLFVGTFALFGFWDAQVADYFPLNVIDQEYFNAALIAAFVVVAIPLLALLLFTVRVALTNRPVNRTLSFVLLVVWLCGIAPLVFYITRTISDFRQGAEFVQVKDLKSYSEYTLNLDRTRFFTPEDSLRYKIDPGSYADRRIVEDVDDDFRPEQNVHLWIVKSEGDKASIVQNFRARGRTFEAALINAQGMRYDFGQQDSLLNFGQALHLKEGIYWRKQEVELTLKVPEGTRINLSRELHRYFSGNLYWDCHEAHEHDHAERDFYELIMTEQGLRCLMEKPEELIE